MCQINRFFFTIIQFILLVDSTKQLNVRSTIMALKAIGKTIKNPLLKNIVKTTKQSIIKTLDVTMKNSVNMFRLNKNTIKNVACGLDKKIYRIKHTLGSKSVKYLGEEGIKKFTQGTQLIRRGNKKNLQMRTAEFMRGKELRSMINMVSKSKPFLPLLFAAGGLERLAHFKLREDHGEDLQWNDPDSTEHIDKNKKRKEWGAEPDLWIFQNKKIPAFRQMSYGDQSNDMKVRAKRDREEAEFTIKKKDDKKPFIDKRTEKNNEKYNALNKEKSKEIEGGGLFKADPKSEEQSVEDIVVTTDQKSNEIARLERLSKYLGRAGVCSRRQAEVMISKGLVKVNGTVTDKNKVIESIYDKVTIMRNKVENYLIKKSIRMWAFYKPKNLICGEFDPNGRQSIFDFIKESTKIKEKLTCIKKLDFQSEGLVLLTNDEDVAEAMALPHNALQQKIKVRVHGQFSDWKLNRIREGAYIEGEKFDPLYCFVNSFTKNNTWLDIKMKEGNNKDIKRTMKKNELMVDKIISQKYGSYSLNGLKSGEIREVKMEKEVRKMVFLYQRKMLIERSEKLKNSEKKKLNWKDRELKRKIESKSETQKVEDLTKEPETIQSAKAQYYRDRKPIAKKITPKAREYLSDTDKKKPSRRERELKLEKELEAATSSVVEEFSIKNESQPDNQIVEELSEEKYSIPVSKKVKEYTAEDFSYIEDWGDEEPSGETNQKPKQKIKQSSQNAPVESDSQKEVKLSGNIFYAQD